MWGRSQFNSHSTSFRGAVSAAPPGHARREMCARRGCVRGTPATLASAARWVRPMDCRSRRTRQFPSLPVESEAGGGSHEPARAPPPPSLRPFRRPLSQKMGPAIRSSYWLVTVAAGCAAARCIPDLSTYAAAPRMLTTPGCTALHVVPAKAQELTSVILLFEDQFVSIQPPILSL